MRARTAWGVLVLACVMGSPATAAWRVAAPAARIKSEGGPLPGGWNLWSQGEVGDFVRVARDGSYLLTVVAGGTPAFGVWPRMAVVVDGEEVAVTNAAGALREHAFPVSLRAGDHRVTVAFLNDAVGPDGEDRNLHVGSLAVSAAAGLPEPEAGEPGRWEADRRGAEAAAEEQELTAARAAIERYRKSDVVLRVRDAQGRPAGDVPVTVTQTAQAFRFGCNIYMFDRFGSARENELYRERFRGLFNYATVGFYWRSYESERGNPQYAYTDAVVAWCRTNGIAMKGHPLLWNNEHGTPPWVQGRPDAALMQARVEAIIGRYHDAIDSWEVVNEPAHLPGLAIDDPYRWARAADPRACLIVNDFQVLADGCPAFFSLLQAAQRNGVPFDGIGIQAHEPRTLRFPLARVRRVLDRYATLGQGLHITEFTPASSGDPVTGSHWGARWDEAEQAAYAERFYTVCFAHPAVRAITWWDLCDRGAWLNGGGLLRADLSPKPAYTALERLVRETWRTRAEGRTDGNGSFAFRGFHGTYAVRAAGGAPVTVSVTADGPREVEVRPN